MVGDWGEVVTR